MNSLFQDMRFAFRMLAKAPGFTLIAVLTLALGIGANTAIFSVVNALFLRSLPVVRAPEDLVWLSRSYSYPLFADFRKENQVFDGLFAQGGLSRISMNAGDRAEVVHGELVTANYFSVLGIEAALGRLFLPAEDQTPGAHSVAVLSHGFWQRRFASDPGVVGRTIKLNGHVFTIVGVAPRGFVGAEIGPVRDLWVPMMMQAQIAPASGMDGNPDMLSRSDFFWMNVIGRLKPGVSVQQAEAAMNTLHQSLIPEAQRAPAGPFNQPIRLLHVSGGLDPRERGDFLAVAALLLGVVGLVLLIACVNLANLLLARASTRHSEIGIRLALGATRWRLVRQMLAESVLLALIGGTLGLLLTLWMGDLFALLEPLAGQPLDPGIRLDGHVLGWNLAVSVLAGIMFGLLPALQASKRDVASALKGDSGSGRGYRRSRLRNTFIVAQMTFSLILLITSGLFLRSLYRAESADPGFQTKNGLLVPLNLNLAGLSEAEGKTFYPRLLEQLESVPGIVSASYAEMVPLGNNSGLASVRFEGQQPKPNEKPLYVGYNVVGPRYFYSMGIPVVHGREFTARDNAAASPVVVINEAAARRFWPSEDPIGKRISVHSGAFSEIIGVVRNSTSQRIGEVPEPFVYTPLYREYSAGATLVVRTAADPAPLVPVVRSELRKLNSDLLVFDVRTLAQHLAVSLLPARMGAGLLGMAGLLALALAAIGIYGVLAYAVNQRVREIGIRMALGAQRHDVLRLVIQEGMTMVALGMAIGLGVSLGVSRLLTAFLYGLSPADPLTYACIPMLLATVALLACWIPARRATRVDPMVALRYE